MTIHSAKGLEFPVVLVTGLEEGLLPHASNLDDLPGLEEERRLFYVGMTRAEDELYLLSASNRRRYGSYEPMMQSRFLRELPEACVEVEPPPATVAPRRGAWAPRQPSWRSYAEGDPDAFWGSQGLDPDAGVEEAPPAATRRRKRGDKSLGRTGRGVASRMAAIGRAAAPVDRQEEPAPAPTPTPTPDGPAHGWVDEADLQEPVPLAVGMRVRHEKFGEGQVLRLEGHGDMTKVTVIFGRSEARKFVARYARLVPV
jgi:DNA helicase-2/ATP-dependent DNA helicase PcrA